MAITYIKLGPIGDLFNSQRLGIYLTPTNSAEIDSSLLQNRLRSFSLTGFLVEISKVEHENIKLKNLYARNIPLVIVPLTDTATLEPVEAVLSTPPPLLQAGYRYLVGKGATDAWEGYDDYIAEYDGSGWIFTKPKNGFTLPIYKWGISTKYSGTHPSGNWDYSTNQLVIIENTPGTGNPTSPEDYALGLVEKEKEERVEADNNLLEIIQQIIQQGAPAIKAIQVSIDDLQGYYSATNVEIALQEIGIRLGNFNQQLESLYNILSQLNVTDLQSILDMINQVQLNLNTERDERIAADGELETAINAIQSPKVTDDLSPAEEGDNFVTDPALNENVTILTVFKGISRVPKDQYIFDPVANTITFTDQLWPGEVVSVIYI